MGFCTSCGVQRVSENDRFCRSCGAPHDPVAPAADPSAPSAPPAPPAPTAAPTSWSVPGSPATVAAPAQPGQPAQPVHPAHAPYPPQPAAPGSSYAPGAPVYAPAPGGGFPVGKLLGVVGLVLAVVAAGVVAWHFFWPRGGAGSPEEAAESAILAAAAQDPVALIDMISPAELEGFDDVYDSVRDRAEEEGLIDGDGITDAVDVELSDLEFDVEELADDVALVTLTDGSYDVSWDPAELPERLSFLAEESDAESDSGDLDDVLEDEEFSFVTVKQGGRWYVTVLGTMAHYAYLGAEREADYRDFNLDEPDFELVSEEVEPVVGDDPEDVVENLVDAINDGDAAELLANLPEDLAAPLRPYIPVVESLQDWGDWGDDIGLSVAAENLELSTEDLNGDKVKVVVEEGLFTGSAWEYDDYGYGSIAVDGECLTAEDEYDAETACLDDEPYVRDLGIDEVFFVVSEVDGGYQLDLTATWVEYAKLAADNLDSNLVDAILEDIEDELDEDYYYDEY